MKVSPCNESKYDDCKEILQYYQEVIDNVHEKVPMDCHQPNYSVSGDQLTRDRLKGMKDLGAGNANRNDRFEDLWPIVSGHFHLSMNCLERGAIKAHFTSNEDSEVGELRSEVSRLNHILTQMLVKHTAKTKRS